MTRSTNILLMKILYKCTFFKYICTIRKKRRKVLNWSNNVNLLLYNNINALDIINFTLKNHLLFVKLMGLFFTLIRKTQVYPVDRCAWAAGRATTVQVLLSVLRVCLYFL